MKRWKKLSIIIPIVMAAVMLVASPVTAMAAQGSSSGTGPAGRGALAIVAPVAAKVNQETQMTVFLRSNQEPFQNAGVWIFTRDEAQSLRQEIQSLRESRTPNTANTDFEAMASGHGQLLGHTDANGRLIQSFSQAGDYVLVAFHGGYLPGFSGLRVIEPPSRLSIDAPVKAKPGEDVTITVNQRDTSTVVQGADVWAVTSDQTAALRADLQTLKNDTSVNATNKDYESVIQKYGTLIGQTDASGQVTYAFTNDGNYALLAVMTGYFPAVKGIHIAQPVQSLFLQAPSRVKPGDDVTLTVSDRDSSTPVGGASVWSVSRDNVQSLRTDLQALRADNSTAPADRDYASVIGKYGSLIGQTDANGQLTTSFAQSGGYLLITTKAGYIPGMAPIGVIAPRQPKTKSDTLQGRGVPGKGLNGAPGLQTPFNGNAPGNSTGTNSNNTN